MNRPWECDVDYSYEGQYALGVEEAKAEIIQRLYECGFTAEMIAMVTERSVPEIAGYTAFIYTVQ